MCKLSGESIFTCAKCRGRDIGVQYEPKGYKVYWSNAHDGWKNFFDSLRDNGFGDPYAYAREEHLLLTCSSCRDSWRRETMDKSASNV